MAGPGGLGTARNLAHDMSSRAPPPIRRFLTESKSQQTWRDRVFNMYAPTTRCARLKARAGELTLTHEQRPDAAGYGG